MLTGRMVELGDDAKTDIGGYLERLVSRSGEPVIRQAMRRPCASWATSSCWAAPSRRRWSAPSRWKREGYRFSFDMLGEAALTAADAERYFAAYRDGARRDRRAPATGSGDVFARPGDLGQALGAASALRR